MKNRKLKVIIESNWDTATPEQKKRFMERLNRAFNILFEKVREKKA